jgi:hypothetical protein
MNRNVYAQNYWVSGIILRVIHHRQNPSVSSRNVYRFDRKTWRNKQLGRPRCRREDNVKINFRGVRDMDWIKLAQDWDYSRDSVKAAINQGVA